MGNIYFDLTREFNEDGTVVLLASGQAVVFYRLAMMSKDGDWILREDRAACAKALEVLGRHGASYRASAPLDPDWLAGGWSSHFEFQRHGARVRCDFVSRPPRLPNLSWADLASCAAGTEGLRVLDIEHLIEIKKTQRAKDYPIIGELARSLNPERELALTTDPDRIERLANLPIPIERPSVQAAREGKGRTGIVLALALEIDAAQRADRLRVERYASVAEPYLREFHAAGIGRLPLPEAHKAALALASRLLPRTLPEIGLATPE